MAYLWAFALSCVQIALFKWTTKWYERGKSQPNLLQIRKAFKKRQRNRCNNKRAYRIWSNYHIVIHHLKVCFRNWKLIPFSSWMVTFYQMQRRGQWHHCGNGHYVKELESNLFNIKQNKKRYVVYFAAEHPGHKIFATSYAKMISHIMLHGIKRNINH